MSVCTTSFLGKTCNILISAFFLRHYLGVVLERQEEHEAASECLFTAVDLEATAPIVSFSIIPRIL